MDDVNSEPSLLLLQLMPATPAPYASFAKYERRCELSTKPANFSRSI